MRLSPAVLRSFRPLIGATAIAGLAGLVPAPAALAQEPTPTPTMELGAPCPAVVTYHWDVTALDHLTEIRWELKDEPFVNPDGLDDTQLAKKKVNQTVGSERIDLRAHGAVLDGSAYYFRVHGRGGGGAPPSEPVVFAVDRTVDGAYAADMDADRNVTVSWNLSADIAGCADRVVWEVNSGGGFAGDWPDPGSDASGETPTSGASSGSAQATLPTNGASEYSARIAARHRGTDPASAVGRTGTAVTVEGPPLAVVPPPTVTPTDACPAVVTLGWDVSGVPGATQAMWELKRGSDFTVPDGDEPGAVRGVENGATGTVEIDLRDHGPVLEMTRYHFRVAARGSPQSVLAPRSASVAFDGGPNFPGLSVHVNRLQGSPRVAEFQVVWGLNVNLAPCIDRVAWEARDAGGGLAATGDALADGMSGSTTGSVVRPDFGEYSIRVVPYYGSLNPEDRIGVAGVGRITLLQVAEAPGDLVTTPARPTVLTPAPRLRVLPQPQLPRMEEYVYSNTWILALLEHAERVGYQHRAVMKQGQGCFLTGRGNAVGTLHAAPLTPGPLPTTCEFHWLTGKPVVDPWTIESVEVNARIRIGRNWYSSPSISCQVESIDQEGGGIVVVGVLQPAPNAPREGRCLIEEIRLRGPAEGKKYWDAFQ